VFCSNIWCWLFMWFFANKSRLKILDKTQSQRSKYLITNRVTIFWIFFEKIHLYLSFFFTWLPCLSSLSTSPFEFKLKLSRLIHFMSTALISHVNSQGEGPFPLEFLRGAFIRWVQQNNFWSWKIGFWEKGKISKNFEVFKIFQKQQMLKILKFFSEVQIYSKTCKNILVNPSWI